MTDEVTSFASLDQVRETPETPTAREEPHLYSYDNDTSCAVCDWCHHRPVEYREPNHEAALCRHCAFTEAPTRPIEPTYSYFKVSIQAFTATPEQFNQRLALNVLHLLLTSQGGYAGDNPFNIDSNGNWYGRPAVISLLVDVADMCGFDCLPTDDWKWNSDEEFAELMEEFLSLIRQYLVIASDRDAFLESLRAIVRMLDTRNDDEGREEIQEALRHAADHIGFVGYAVDERGWPLDGGPAMLNPYAKRFPSQHKGISHASPFESVPERRYTAKAPRRNRRRARGD